MRRAPLRRHISTGALLACALTAPALAAPRPDPVEAYSRSHQRETVAHLEQLTRLRSIAAEPAQLAATAELLESWLRQRGFATTQLRASNDAAPLVFGSYRVRGAKRTVLFYAHYDGQPVTSAQWHSDPFVPVMRDGAAGVDAQAIDWRAQSGPLGADWRMFGRAVADDKASIIAFLAAFDALRGAARGPAVNIKVAWEGEEESGSPHIAALLDSHRDQFSADLWLIGDGPVHQSGEPTLYFGARGQVGLELRIYGPERALHDGHYGNWAPNPALMAAELLSQMRDSEGRILIPGFSAAVRPLPAAARSALAQLPPVEEQLRQKFGLGRTEGSEGLTASTLRPALNIRGIRSGQVGSEAANAIPVEAEVSLDFRLVPDQTPEQVRACVEQFLRDRGWSLIDHEPDAPTRRTHGRLVRLTWQPGYPALSTDMDATVARAVIATMRHASPQPLALLPMMGGSVPLYVFREILGVPIIGLPIVNYDDSQHAADENLRLGNLWSGVSAYAALMGRLNW